MQNETTPELNVTFPAAFVINGERRGDAFEIDAAREQGPGAIREGTKRTIEMVKKIQQDYWKFEV